MSEYLTKEEVIKLIKHRDSAHPWPLIPLSELTIKPIEWLIYKMIPKDSLVLLWAPYGAYKSFLTIDWLSSIATGEKWNGRAVSKGAAIYICGEGRNNIKVRFKAWSVFHGSHNESGVFIGDPIDLSNEETCSDIIEHILSMDIQPKIVAIDTLATNFAGDENSTRDMSMLIGNAKKIKDALDCAVLIVHHAGKNNKCRGAIALPSAIDVEMSIKSIGEKSAALICKKQKEEDRFDDMYFATEVVALDGLHDSEGNAVTSLVITPNNCKLVITKVGDKIKCAILCLIYLREQFSTRSAAEKFEVSDSTILRVLKELKKSGHITAEGSTSNTKRHITASGVEHLNDILELQVHQEYLSKCGVEVPVNLQTEEISDAY